MHSSAVDRRVGGRWWLMLIPLLLLAGPAAWPVRAQSSVQAPAVAPALPAHLQHRHKPVQRCRNSTPPAQIPTQEFFPPPRRVPPWPFA